MTQESRSSASSTTTSTQSTAKSGFHCSSVSSFQKMIQGTTELCREAAVMMGSSLLFSWATCGGEMCIQTKQSLFRVDTRDGELILEESSTSFVAPPPTQVVAVMGDWLIRTPQQQQQNTSTHHHRQSNNAFDDHNIYNASSDVSDVVGVPGVVTAIITQNTNNPDPKDNQRISSSALEEEDLDDISMDSFDDNNISIIERKDEDGSSGTGPRQKRTSTTSSSLLLHEPDPSKETIQGESRDQPSDISMESLDDSNGHHISIIKQKDEDDLLGAGSHQKRTSKTSSTRVDGDEASEIPLDGGNSQPISKTMALRDGGRLSLHSKSEKATSADSQSGRHQEKETKKPKQLSSLLLHEPYPSKDSIQRTSREQPSDPDKTLSTQCTHSRSQEPVSTLEEGGPERLPSTTTPLSSGETSRPNTMRKARMLTPKKSERTRSNYLPLTDQTRSYEIQTGCEQRQHSQQPTLESAFSSSGEPSSQEVSSSNELPSTGRINFGSTSKRRSRMSTKSKTDKESRAPEGSEKGAGGCSRDAASSQTGLSVRALRVGQLTTSPFARYSSNAFLRTVGSKMKTKTSAPTSFWPRLMRKQKLNVKNHNSTTTLSKGWAYGGNRSRYSNSSSGRWSKLGESGHLRMLADQTMWGGEESFSVALSSCEQNTQDSKDDENDIMSRRKEESLLAFGQPLIYCSDDSQSSPTIAVRRVKDKGDGKRFTDQDDHSVASELTLDAILRSTDPVIISDF